MSFNLINFFNIQLKTYKRFWLKNKCMYAVNDFDNDI